MKKRKWFVFFTKLALILSGIGAVVGFFIGLQDYGEHPLFSIFISTVGGFVLVWFYYALLLVCYVLYKLLYVLFQWAWRSSEIKEEEEEGEKEK